jgi:hypothetical protein
MREEGTPLNIPPVSIVDSRRRPAVAAVNTNRSNYVPEEYGPLLDDEYDDDAELLWQLFASAAPALAGVALIVLATAAAVVAIVFG